MKKDLVCKEVSTLVSYHQFMALSNASKLFFCLLYIFGVWPPPSNSDHQDYYIFNRESL